MRLGKYALLLCALAACSKETTGPSAVGEAVLLEIEYINYAWVPTYFGFYVDGTGDVYKYDRKGTAWAHDGDRVVAEEDLVEKFSMNRTLLSTRDSAEIKVIANRIAEVNTSQLSQPNMVCADAGKLTYRAYKYNPGSRTYQPVLLRVEGDIAQQNTSAAALELVAYIRSLDLAEELLGCDP